MSKHTVCLLGCGPRGDDHLHGFTSNPDRFDVVGLCDQDAERLAAMAEKYSIDNTFADGEEMLSACQPEVFCFTTMPNLRLSLVELGIRHGVKAIAFEKPMALSLAEARKIRDVCAEAGVEFIVSHQQKYGSHYRAIKDIVDAGRIGDVYMIRATARSWLMQLGTHLIDYILWLNGGARGKWVIGQVHGKERFADSHPSPDHVFGEIYLENDVRAIVEFGPLAPQYLADDQFWVDDTLTAYGSHGYARMTLGKGWEAMTKDSGGEVISGEGAFNPQIEQPLYMRDLADWLDDPTKIHPCNGDISYHGFELAMGLCLSSLERRKVDIPIENIPTEPLFEQLKKILPDTKTETQP